MNYFQNIQNANNIDLNIFQFGQERVLPHGFCGPTFRKHYVVHFIIDGKGIFRQEDESFPVSAGQAFLISPNTKVFYQADEVLPYSYVWVEFDGLKVKDCLTRAGLTKKNPIFTPKDGDCSSEHLKNLIASNNNGIRINAYFLLFLDSLISNSSNAQHIRSTPGDLGEMYIRHVIDYISLNYWKRITVDILSNMCGINRSYLSRLFRQKIGLSPQEYIIQYKVDMACQLLSTTQLSIAEISNSVGYTDQFTFSKIFKSIKNVSPSDWRSTHYN